MRGVVYIEGSLRNSEDSDWKQQGCKVKWLGTLEVRIRGKGEGGGKWQKKDWARFF